MRNGMQPQNVLAEPQQLEKIRNTGRGMYRFPY